MDTATENIKNLATILDSAFWLPYAYASFLGMFGGLVNYFYFIEKRHLSFKLRSFFTTAGLGWLIGIIAFSFLPDSPNKNGWLLACGFFCWQIVAFVEKNGERFFKLIGK